MIKGFRDFLMRGNVIDLAVAVIIGTAFSKVVTAVADGLIGSIIAELGGKPNFDQLSIGFVQVGSTITALINFLIVATVVYFIVVVPVNRLAAFRRRPSTADEPPVPEDIALLTEIRDLLANRQGGPTLP